MRRLLSAAGIAAALLASGAAWAKAPAAKTATPAAATAPAAPAALQGRALTAADAEAWFDGIMEPSIDHGEIVGAVVAVVKDGQVLFEKGYGYSDLEKKTPVDPKTTLFRPGSVSKLFVWTSVMQLVEQGKIDLDADVNQYLDFKIPPRNGKPITMRNIMTHTTGFEEAIKGLIVPKADKFTLESQLKKWTPTRVFDPGTTPAYSNYGNALAGYIVQRVSGQKFEDYVAEHIYKPLGMEHSTFEQPLPANLAPLMSKGYRNASTKPEPFEIVTLAPAGSMSASADDMAKFMIAHLQNGKFGDAQILKPETAVQMHTSYTRIMAPLNGIALGFYEQNINGMRVIAHGGDTQFFHSNLLLFLDKNVGLFMSVNSAGIKAGGLREDVFSRFADRYFPAPNTDGTVDAKTAMEHAKMAAGDYISARGAFSSFMALTGLLQQPKIIAFPDGTIAFSMLPRASGLPRKYKEIQPFVWREIGGHDRIGAIVKDGKVVRVSSDVLSGIMVFDRAPTLKSASFLMPALLASLGVLGLTLIGWPVLAIVRSRYGHKFTLEGSRANAYRLVRVAAILAFVALGAWVYAVQSLFKDANVDGLIILASALTVIGFVGGFLISLYNLFTAFTSKTSWWGKLWSVLLTLSFLLLLWIGFAGQLMSFHTNY